MKRLALLAVVPALLIGCSVGSDDEPASGLEAASTCLESGGATNLMSTDGDLQFSVAAKGPEGSFIMLASSDADTVVRAARKMRRSDDTDLVTRLTPDHQAVAAVELTDPPSMADWKLGIECSLVLPKDPGEGNGKIRDDEMFLNTEFNAAVVDAACDLRPGRMSNLLIEDAAAANIGLRRWDGYMNRVAGKAARFALREDTHDSTCRMLKSARPGAI